MNNRLGDLRRFNQSAGSDPDRPPGDLEMGRSDGHTDYVETVDSFMKDFYAEVDQIKDLMEKIESNIDQIGIKYSENLTAFRADEAEKVIGELEAMVSQTNQFANQVNSALKQMQKDNKSSTFSNAEQRVRTSIHTTLAKRFYDLMLRYQQLKTENNQKYRERVAYQVEVATGEPPKEEELDQIMETGDTNRLFATKILQDKRHEDAANALIFVKDQHADIMKLEKSINEVYTLFQDMALLVEEQGEMLTIIEENVAAAGDYNEKTLTTLMEANKQAKLARKKLLIICILICCIICVICVIIIVLICIQFCGGLNALTGGKKSGGGGGGGKKSVSPTFTTRPTPSPKVSPTPTFTCNPLATELCA